MSRQTKVKEDIEIPRNPKIDKMMRNSCYDYTIIVVSLLYAIQIAVVVRIEDSGSFLDYNMVGLAVLQVLFASLFVFDLVLNLLAKGF